MMESWLIEFLKGVGRLFINPLFYWSLILVLLVGYRRIRQERLNFGSRVFDVFSEWKHTWGVALISGLIISVFMVGIGIVFSYETFIVLSLVTIVLSLTLRFTMLSPSYTIGITYLLLLFIPAFWDQQTFVDQALFSHINFTGLAVMVGLFLIIEAILIIRNRRNDSYPSLVKGKRGGWIGQHQIKKMSLIPFFVLIPSGALTSIEPYWPVLPVGDETFSLMLIPFLIGYDHKVRTELPNNASKRIGRSILLLSLLVLLLAGFSYYVPWLSLASVLIAIIGREIINYRERMINKKNQPYFYQDNLGLRVLSIIPNSPAERLGILVGEKIVKVNDIPIHSHGDFYESLQNSGSFFKIEIVDDQGEVRFLQSPFYEGEHHKLGLIFVTKPYRQNS